LFTRNWKGDETRMRVFIDSIHQGVARVLLGDDASVTVLLPAAWLPAGSREGLVLQCEWRIDPEATAGGIQQVQALLDDLGDAP